MNNLESVLILKYGGIHIKPENKGKFTDYCGGKVTQECIQRGKHSSNPTTRKRATFAANTRRWKHENGGILKAQEGTGNLYAPHPLSPVGIALNQAKAMTKGKIHLPPGVKEVVGPDGKKVAIRTEQPLVPLEQSIAEWLPGTGDVAEVGYIANDVKNGNYGSAALATAMVALPGNVGKVLRKSDIPASKSTKVVVEEFKPRWTNTSQSKLSESERLGIPKVERNQVLNGHLKGDAAVQMFKEYGTTTIPSNSKIYSQIQQLVPEARERYKLVGRTDITDDEIAGSLYKRAMELSGNSNAAIWETGEPRLLFRGDTRRYNRLMDKWSPDKLAKGEGTMDNSLGNLFLGDISGKGQGVDRYFISGTDFWEPMMQGSSTGARGKFGTIFANGGEGIQGTNIPYIPKDAYKLSTYQTYHVPYSLYKFPGKYSESGISDLNAFITRTPAMRDATGEISVLADDVVMKTKNYRGPNIDDYDGPTYDGVNSTVRDAMAKHYQSILDDAQSKGQGLLFSEGLTDEYVKKFGEIHPFRREHEWYDYYALPNFNRQNAKHLFGWDLRRPVQWDIDNIYLEKGGKL